MGAATVRARWRRWRRSRPFWGGLAAALAGAEICALPLAPLKIMLQQGIAGVPSVLMGLVMILMGLSAWFTPQHRTLAGVLTVLGATAALVMSNLGGFLLGTVLGILGGALIFAWQPVTADVAEGDGTSGGAEDAGAAGPETGPEAGPEAGTAAGPAPTPGRSRP
ncbi:DUF6114 domain-containing protein [Streptomyces sp. BBFR2]|uniref:DUF6114 domain-containing protein n=1 Tax=Streptomyces sp. BBFR2 TaxID=3372854 RepID=UPI0037DA50CA